MPTEAGCGLCGWQEIFDNHRAAKQAAADHDCQPETDQNPPAWIKDIENR